MIGKYEVGELTKAFITLFIGIIAVFTTAVADNDVTGLEWLGVIVAVINAIVVFSVSNANGGFWYWKKAIFGAIGTALASFVTSLSGNVAEGLPLGDLIQGITTAQWLTLLTAVLGGILVAIAPNAQTSTTNWEGPVDDEQPESGYESGDLSDEDLAGLPNEEELQRRALQQGE